MFKIKDNFSIYCTWKNIRQQYRNQRKIIAPTWNDEFELPGGSYSVSDIRKKNETLPNNRPIHIYNKRINSRIMFKIKDGYKLELQTPETMKLFGSTKKLIDKKKNGANLVKVVLAQRNLVNNQYQQKSEVLHTFMDNKS